MSVQRIASRYAKSLLDLSIERNEMETVAADIDYVTACLTSRDLYLMIKSPIINTGKKKTIFKRIFADKLSKTTNSFLDIMLRKGRENLLPEIMETFKEQYKSYKQISTVILKTAVELKEDTIALIKKKLENSSEAKKNIDLQVVVDPTLVGGFTLEFEGKQYDSSLAYKLRQLKKQFSSN